MESQGDTIRLLEAENDLLRERLAALSGELAALSRKYSWETDN